MSNELRFWQFLVLYSVLAGEWEIYSRAGFGNTRHGGIPICFYCHLQPRPTPWEEDLFQLHADLCPHCPFVRIKNWIIMRKAAEFVSQRAPDKLSGNPVEEVQQTDVKDLGLPAPNLPLKVNRGLSDTTHIEEVEPTVVKDLRLPSQNIPLRVNRVLYNRRPLIDGARRPSLKRRTSDLIKKYACQRCNSRPRQILFVPCYHFYSCETCAEDTEECQRCQQPILRKVKIYRS